MCINLRKDRMGQNDLDKVFADDVNEDIKMVKTMVEEKGNKKAAKEQKR